MKTVFEAIQPDSNSSFRLLRNPNLSDLFYWHFHPEFELVYIEGTDGTRHVGEHISSYCQSDLVFIGSNIPHLNFDYGVQGEYEKVVLHIHPRFQEQLLGNFPELGEILALFNRSKYGIAFGERVKEAIGPRLKNFYSLDPFQQFIEAFAIFQVLAQTHDFHLLHPIPYVNRYSEKEQERMRNVYAYIDRKYQHKIRLGEVATLCSMTPSAFCRYFRQITGQTFVSFLNQYRISQAKRLLLVGKTVSEACYECGFESLSYFNRTFKKITSENPTTFRKRHLGS
ncbi:MAG: AraC family transcriptional regulator [Bacteroidota bacterium]